jgi:Ca2+-transporting ATPase
MQAFINFLISCNVGEVLAVFLASVMGFPSILSAMQLLWINLATDGPAAVALGFNPPDENVMIEKPRDINEAIITPWFLVRYLIIGSYIGIVTVGIFSSHYQIERGISIQQLSEWSTCHQWSGATSSICDSLFSPEGLALPQTLAISTLITTELLKALCTVSVNSSIFKFSPFKNPYLLVGVTIPFAAHLLILYTPTVSKSFGMVPLSMDQWICVLTWSLPVMLVDEILKVVGNRIR